MGTILLYLHYLTLASNAYAIFEGGTFYRLIFCIWFLVFSINLLLAITITLYSLPKKWAALSFVALVVLAFFDWKLFLLTLVPITLVIWFRRKKNTSRYRFRVAYSFFIMLSLSLHFYLIDAAAALVNPCGELKPNENWVEEPPDFYKFTGGPSDHRLKMVWSIPDEKQNYRWYCDSLLYDLDDFNAPRKIVYVE